MSILIEHNGVNINDYVVACEKIPYFHMNIDSTLGLPTYTLEVSNTYPGTLYEGNIINVTVNGKLIHNGFIAEAENLYESRTTRLTILPTLAYLQNTNIDLGSLDLTSSDPEHYAADPVYPDLHSVTLLWFLERMFTVAGLTLDTSAVASYSVGTAYEYYSPYTAIPFTGADIALDHNAIYCLNQNFATLPSEVKIKYIDNAAVTDYEALKNQPSFFEVIIQICSFFGWIIVMDGGYKLLPLGSQASAHIPDDSIYQYSLKRESPEADACKYETKYALRGYYAIGAKTEVDFLDSNIYPPETTYGKNLNTIEWMNNLWFMLRDRRQGAIAGSLRTLGSGSSTVLTFSPVILHADVNFKRADMITKNKVITETTTDFNTSVLSVHEHYFDLENRTTMIKEISFL